MNITLPHCFVMLNIIYIHKNQDDFSLNTDPAERK